MRLSVDKHNVHIEDSWTCPRNLMSEYIRLARFYHPESYVWLRSDRSILQEWHAHNILYKLHIARSHTKDVDLNYPQALWEVVGYAILGTLFWWA